MKTWELEERREHLLDNLIKKYGFEAEPTVYFATYAWKDIHNMDRYYSTAINWVFNWDE